MIFAKNYDQHASPFGVVSVEIMMLRGGIVMKRSVVLTLLFLVAVFAWSSAQAAMMQVPIDFSAHFNSNNGRYGSHGVIPSGNVTLGGVDFCLPVVDNLNTWDSIPGASSGVKTLTVDLSGLGLYGADKFYTLINNSWGYYNQTLTTVSFAGSEGASYSWTLKNGYDVRDWLNGYYANTLTAQHAQQVWTSGGTSRVDMQIFDLPDDFLDEYLTTVTIQDFGALNNHRAFVYGMTAEVAAVPVPAALLLFGSGLACLVAARRMLMKY